MIWNFFKKKGCFMRNGNKRRIKEVREAKFPLKYHNLQHTLERLGGAGKRPEASQNNNSS